MKKLTLGLMLLPLVPLSAIGVVEIVNQVSKPDAVVTTCRPIEVESYVQPHFAKPPAPTPRPHPAPTA